MSQKVIGVIGLGYVGLPLAIEFGKQYKTIGFDVKIEAIENYEKGVDLNNEVDAGGFTAATQLSFTTDPTELKKADFLIVAVPTPIDSSNQPDLTPLVSASRTAWQNMKSEAVVVFESTVFPGATEEVCVPILEQESGLTWKQDFHVGYSH